MKVLAVVAAVFASLALSVEGDTCCYPSELKGNKITFMGNKRIDVQFFADYNAGYIAESEDVNSGVWTIYNINDGRKYYVSSAGCSSTPMLNTNLFNQCFNSSDLVKDDEYVGVGDQLLNVNLYDYVIGTIKVTKQLEVVAGHCHPMVSQSLVHGKISILSFYFKVRLGIWDGPDVASLLSQCEQN